jgi:hypothetical protein
MTAKPYVPTSWGDEPIFTDKLNQMTNNDQWLFENSPRMYYSGYGVKKPNGIKIMGSVLTLAGSKTKAQYGTYNFGTFFSSGCLPIVATSVNPQSGYAGFSLAIRGISSNVIDNRGFIATLYADAPFHPSVAYIHFIALGW